MLESVNSQIENLQIMRIDGTYIQKKEQSFLKEISTVEDYQLKEKTNNSVTFHIAFEQNEDWVRVH